MPYHVHPYVHGGYSVFAHNGLLSSGCFPLRKAAEDYAAELNAREMVSLPDAQGPRCWRCRVAEQS